MLVRARAEVEFRTGSSSFLKKRTKKLLSVPLETELARYPVRWPQRVKVFCFFFQKRSPAFLPPRTLLEMICQLRPPGQRAVDHDGLHELRRIDEYLPALVGHVVAEYLRTPVPV